MPIPTLTQSIVITLIQCLLVVIFVFVVVQTLLFDHIEFNWIEPNNL